MDKQTKYAIDQYNMCCYHLNISPRYDDDGNTLFEEIVLMEKEIETLDNECWKYRLDNPEILAKKEQEYQNLLNFTNTVIMHVDDITWRNEFLQELKKHR